MTHRETIAALQRLRGLSRRAVETFCPACVAAAKGNDREAFAHLRAGCADPACPCPCVKASA